jgi:hypothetical protein
MIFKSVLSCYEIMKLIFYVHTDRCIISKPARVSYSNYRWWIRSDATFARNESHSIIEMHAEILIF